MRGEKFPKKGSRTSSRPSGDLKQKPSEKIRDQTSAYGMKRGKKMKY